MRPLLSIVLALLAFAGCDRVTSPHSWDAGVDSLASLWERVDAGTVNYNAVAGTGPENIFIVGDQGTILHWDGTALVPEASGTTANLRGVATVGEWVVAVGEGGALLRREAGVWIVDPPVTTAVLNGVYMGVGYVVAVGEQGTILVFAGDVWGPVPNTRSDNYYAVTDTNEGIIVVGALGVVVHIDAPARTIVSQNAVVGYTKVLAGAVRYGAGAYLVGVDGGLYFWANNQGTKIPGLPQKFARGIGLVAGTAWIVGHEGLVASMPQSGKVAPTLIPVPDDRWLLGVYGAVDYDVWMVGRSGLILRGPPGVHGIPDGGIRD